MVNDQDPADSQAVINWDLAFEEFNTETVGGFPSNDGSGQRRPVLGVICKSATDVTANMEHLAGNLRLPAILTTLSADDLLDAWAYTKSPAYTSAGGKAVFFMSTGSADLRLATLLDNGLVWHQLGNPRVLARTMAGLLSYVEPVVEVRRQEYYDANSTASGVEDPGEVPLRVTLVNSDDLTMIDIANVLTEPSEDDTSTMLFFNGQAAIDQLGDGGADPGDFRRVDIESIRNHASPDVAPAIEDIAAHPPHVIVAMGTAEFASTVIPSIESAWDSGANTQDLPRPIYLLSHFIYNTSELRTTLNTTGFSPASRIVGVNYALAQDSRSQGLYQSYLARLQNSYSGSLALAGTENYYDGAYALLYSLAAAAAVSPNPTGLDIRDGLDRVISTNTAAPLVNIGPTNIGTYISRLTNDLFYEMGLWGTMGPPDFDRVTGTRVTATSAWCIELVDTTWTYRADGLLFDGIGTFTPADPLPACLQDFVP
jgi:hypothetical protein